jgi:beta-lactamase superfamily II metal-dependent hydrolase
MDGELLVRVYNVGLGDCIYLRVPDRDDARHVLIDCGNKYASPDHLRAAVADLKENLPPVPARPEVRRLDLLVATHAHEDHVKGFDTELFEGIEIRRIWLSAAMDREHPQAEGAHALQGFAERELERLRLSPNRSLAAWADSMLALSKSDGLDALLEGLPDANGIEPLFVHAGTPAAELGLFADPETRLRVLAPMEDIDFFYVGELAEALRGFQERRAGAGAAEPGEGPAGGEGARPENVSAEDFELLRASLSDNALAFVLDAGHLVNNTSVVLLLEWRGRRLLFTGDAEVKTAFRGAFKEGRTNGSWNVLLREQRDALSRPVDFLKVGHHGSHNATPWTAKPSGGGPHPINAILDSLLPPAEEGAVAERFAVVSTERTNGYPTIPDPGLMVELGRRVADARAYEEPQDKGHFVPGGEAQPPRTDLEHQTAGGDRVPWIDVRLAPT